MAERTTTHKSQRGNLDFSRVEAALNLLGRQHIVKGVVKRAEIGIDLLPHVAGQETKALTSLHSRTRQDDPLDLAALQHPRSMGDRDIGLAGTRRAGGEG